MTDIRQRIANVRVASAAHHDRILPQLAPDADEWLRDAFAAYNTARSDIKPPSWRPPTPTAPSTPRQKEARDIQRRVRANEPLTDRCDTSLPTTAPRDAGIHGARPKLLSKPCQVILGRLNEPVPLGPLIPARRRSDLRRCTRRACRAPNRYARSAASPVLRAWVLVNRRPTTLKIDLRGQGGRCTTRGGRSR